MTSPVVVLLTVKVVVVQLLSEDTIRIILSYKNTFGDYNSSIIITYCLNNIVIVVSSY